MLMWSGLACQAGAGTPKAGRGGKETDAPGHTSREAAQDGGVVGRQAAQVHLSQPGRQQACPAQGDVDPGLAQQRDQGCGDDACTMIKTMR